MYSRPGKSNDCDGKYIETEVFNDNAYFSIENIRCGISAEFIFCSKAEDYRLIITIHHE